MVRTWVLLGAGSITTVAACSEDPRSAAAPTLTGGSTGASAGGASAGGTSAGGASAGGTSAGGTSAGGTSAGGAPDAGAGGVNAGTGGQGSGGIQRDAAADGPRTDASDATRDADMPETEAGPGPGDGSPPPADASQGPDGGVSDQLRFRCGLLDDIYPGDDYNGADAFDMVAGGSDLYFTALIPEGHGFFHTDGTRAGTGRVTGPSFAYPSYVVNHRGQALGVGGLGLVAFNGPVVTTFQTIQEGTSNPPLSWGDHVYLPAGTEILRTNGTVLEHLPLPAELASVSELLGVVGGGLLFTAETQGGQAELWRTNAEGTVMVRLYPPVSGGSHTPTELVVQGDVAFYAGFDGPTGHLFRTDGTPAGTTRIDGPMEVLTPLKVHGGFLGDVFHFAGKAPASTIGFELYRVGPGDSGASLVKDLSSLGDSNPTGFVRYGDLLYFTTRPTRFDGTNGLHATDGTLQGTRHIYRTDIGQLTYPVVFGDRLLFGLSGGNADSAVFLSDGTTEGTHSAWILQPSPATEILDQMAVAGGHVYLSADNGTSGRELQHCWSQRLPGAPLPTCGNGTVDEATEECDGANLMGFECRTAAGDTSTGTLTCTSSCRFDFSECAQVP